MRESALFLKNLADNHEFFYEFLVKYSSDFSRFIFYNQYIIVCVASCDIDDLDYLYETLEKLKERNCVSSAEEQLTRSVK